RGSHNITGPRALLLQSDCRHYRCPPRHCDVPPSPGSPAAAAVAGIPSIRRSPVNCHETQELLHAYLDGELDIVRDVEMARHMDQGPDCAQVHHRHPDLRAALRTIPLAFPPPEDLQRRIRSAVRRASRADTPTRVWAWPWLRVGAALAASVLLIWRMGFVPIGPSPEDVLTQEVIAG